MCVALGTLNRDAHQALHGGLNTILYRSGSEFLIGCPAFRVGHCVPVERGGKACVIRGTGDDVTGELKGYELVVRDVAVEGIDDPVAPWPEVGTQRI